MKLLNNNELDNGAHIYVVLGQVGVGKSSLVNNHEGRRLVLSFDDSYSTLKRDDGLQVITDITSKEIVETDAFLRELTDLSKDFDLIVFDNISAMQQMLVDQITDGEVGSNKNGQAAYGLTQKIMRKLVRWSTTFQGDVLFTLWSKFENGFETADMNSLAFNSVAGFAEVVGRAYVDNDYMVALQPSLEGVAKNRMNKIDKAKNEKFWSAVKYREGE